MVHKITETEWCSPTDKGQYKTWTLDSGLDCGLDSGLNNGLNIWSRILNFAWGSEVMPNYSAAKFWHYLM